MALEASKGRDMKAIVAMTRDRVIGKNNKMPWRLPGEQKWFKEVTMGHPILMGRKTFESIDQPLPGRRNLVVTRTGNFAGVDVIHDLNEFDPRPYESDGREIFVIGGAEVYKALLVLLRFSDLIPSLGVAGSVIATIQSKCG
jgi:dihydrofolate reductase